MVENIRKIDTAIILFIVTGLGYLISYVYELGFLKYYHLPYNLVEIDIVDLIRNISIVLFFMLSGTVAQRLLINDGLNKNGKLTKLKYYVMRPSIVNYIIQIIFIGLFVYFSFFRWKADSYISTPLIAGLLFLMMFFILKRKYFLLVIVTFAWIIVFAYQVGSLIAFKTESYLNLEDTNLIVIDYYQDKAIVAEANFEKKIIYPEYQFINLETPEINKVKFELVNTGEMEVAKVKKK